MSQVSAVIGYLPEEVAKAAATGDIAEPLQVRPERDTEEMHIRVDGKDVQGVLMGATKDGQTAVQVFLRDEATVETVFHSPVHDLALKPIRDRNFFWPRPPINVIYVDPPRVRQLVEEEIAKMEAREN